jgi:hypothetical protein
MSSRGAWLYESLPEPIAMPRPTNSSSERVIITGRWLARGVFSTATLVSANQAKPGFIRMAEALAQQPGLTPKGTVEVVDWRTYGADSVNYLLPLRDTLCSAAKTAGHNAAVSLLHRFPDRVNLAPRGTIDATDRPVVSGTVQSHASPALVELRDGVESIARSVEGIAHLGSLLPLQHAAEDFLQLALATTLATFRDTRMHTAHFQFELYKTEGPIGELINTLGIKTSQNALPSISALLAKSPLSQPPLVMFKPALREALQEAKQASPVARELWASLFREERASILKSAAKLARSIAVRDYAATN